MALLAASLVTSTSLGLNNIKRSDAARSAYYTAFSALQIGLAHLEDDPLWSAGFPFKTSLTSHRDKQFTLLVRNNVSGTSPILIKKGLTLPPGNVYLEAKAYYQDHKTTLTATAVKQRGYTFEYAAFGSNKVTITGTSAIGSAPEAGLGDVRTDSPAAGTLSLGAGTTVDGDLVIGNGGDPASSITLDPLATFSGQAFSVFSSLTIPSRTSAFPSSTTDVVVRNRRFFFIPWPGFHTLSPGNYNNVIVGTPGDFLPNFLYLRPGTYHIKSLQVRGSFMPNFVIVTGTSGPAIVHIQNDFRSFFGFINNGGKADQLQFFFSDNSVPTTMRLILTFGSFVAAGPTLGTTIAASTIHGAVASQNIDINSSVITYDTTLQGKPLGDELKGRWRLKAVQRYENQ